MTQPKTPSDLREQIACLIPPPEVSNRVDDWPEDERDLYRNGVWTSFDERTDALNWHRQLKVSDALLPLVRAQVGAARRDALIEAADELSGIGTEERSHIKHWLRARAGRIRPLRDQAARERPA